MQDGLLVTASQAKVAERGVVCPKVGGWAIANANEDVIMTSLRVYISLHVRELSANLWRENFLNTVPFVCFICVQYPEKFRIFLLEALCYL